jgi:hypothetical protein
LTNLKSKKYFCFVILIILLGFLNNIKSQSLYLKPFGGVQSLLCSYDKNIGKTSTFNINYLNTASDIGFLLDYKLNNKLSVLCGISFSKIGWSYSLTIPKNLINNPNGISNKKMHSEGLIMHRFPLLFNYTFTEMPLYKNQKKEILKSLQFKIGGGINIDNVPDIMTKEDTLDLSIATNYGDTIKYSNNWNYISHNKTGISIAMNFNIGFHNKVKNKDLFELTFYFNQGLINIINVDVNYQLNSIHSNTKLYSKGTNYGIVLCIPIKIFSKL